MTVDDYIDSLPEDRRIAIRAVREALNAKLPAGFEEGIVYNMISWFVPFTRLAETYNGQPLCVASLGSQKGYMVLHLMSVYGDPKLRTWFEKAYKASGKKLDMGKGCLRFKTLDHLPLGVIGETIGKVSVDSYVAAYEKARAGRKTATAKAKKPLAKKPAAKKLAAKKPAAKKAAKTKLRAAVARAKRPAKKRAAARA
jgi:hypothetical protein